MRHLFTILGIGAVLAWVVYLSWPVSADDPLPARRQEVRGEQRSPAPAKFVPMPVSTETLFYVGEKPAI